MNKIGRLRKLPKGGYQLQYWGRGDFGYKVEDTSTSYKKFKNREEALRFIKEKNIEIEKNSDVSEF